MDRGATKNAHDHKEEAGWQYKPEGYSGAQVDDSPALGGEVSAVPSDGVEWTASEFVAHDKTVSWYVLVAIGGFVIAAIVFFVTHDIFSTAIVVILAVAFAVAGSAKPRTLQYRIDSRGITIGNKLRSYGLFKSFMLIQDGAFTSITFMPLKRFMPSLSIYFSPEDEQRIVNALSSHLPLQPPSNDLIDRLMRHIRF